MSKNQKTRHHKVEKQNPHKINSEIRVPLVKLVGEGEPQTLAIDKALALAEEKELDLVMVGETAVPPIVKLMNYSKYLYELGKKPTNKPKPMKEVRFRPNTDDNDLKVKTKHIINFLEKGHKVKVFVFFNKGREKSVMKEQGEKLMLKLAVDLEPHGIVEALPKMEGDKINMFIRPRKKNEGGTDKQD